MAVHPSSGEFLVLGALEILLNQALTLHPQGPDTLLALAGKTVRVRAYDPDFIFYCLIDESGVELATEFDGDAQIRIRGSTGNLLYQTLLPRDQNRTHEEPSGIQIDGDAAAVDSLLLALDTFNLWEAMRIWIRQYVAMPEIFGLLRQHDPEWLARLQSLPQIVEQVLSELEQQKQIQQQILEEIRLLQSVRQHTQTHDLWIALTGAVLLILALLMATKHLPVWAAPDEQVQIVILAVLGLALMMSRLLGRYFR